MQADREAATNGRAPLAEGRTNVRSELDRLRVTCRRQAKVIDALGETMTVLRAGAGALKAENAGLRAADRRMRARRGAHSSARRAAQDAELTEVRLALDAKAPAAARAIVAHRLRDRSPDSLIDDAQLVTSELVTNSVRHSDAPAEAVLVFRLELSHSGVRLEVEDPGRGGAVAAHPPELDGGGGYGLNLVQRLSERWGMERVATGGTRVWARIAPGSTPPSTS
jgi:anti-sigma regulatory factor (Ser/Thr protein kinase)